RHLSQSELENYCKHKKLIFKLPKGTKPEKRAKSFSEFLEKNQEAKKTAEIDFQEIKNIANEKGSMMLFEYAKRTNQSTPDKEIDEMSSYDKAMWFFLNQRETFDQVATECEIENASGWMLYKTKPFKETDILGKEGELSTEVKNYYYVSELRGKICKVETISKDDYICCVAYPQDYTSKYATYEKSALNKNTILQPVFKIYFLCSPKEQRIGIKAQGGWKKREDLIKMFAKTVLGQTITSGDRIQFNLNKLKDFDFPFGTPPEDNVESVKVTSIKLSYPRAENRHITINVGNEGHGLKDIGKWITAHNIPIDQPNIAIAQAKIRIKFKRSPLMPKRARGTVTALITAPSSCNLGVKPLQLKVKGYLKDWGIDTSE
ncbi:hypothetical protein ACFL3M_03810, partial [Patescibacteria group bacterium]